jgi:PKD repeat protein
METNENKPNPQDKVNLKETFIKEEIEKKLPEKKDNSQKDATQTKKVVGNSIYIWIFFGLVLLIFIGLLVSSVYMLQTEGGIRVFQTFGVDINSANLLLRTTINSIYVFFSIILLMMMLIGFGIVASTDKKSPIKSSGIKSLVFSILFLSILAISYFALFPILYKDVIDNNREIDYSKYITVNPDPPQGSAPLRVFIDATNIDEVNDDLFFEWDFGDNSAPGTGPKTSHEFTKPGIYSVKLTLSNAEGTYEVNPNITVLIHNTSAVPKITTDVTQGKAPLTVHFDAGTSEDPNGEIIEYLWTFDDSKSSTNQYKGIEAIHTFTEAGNYDVILTIKDKAGETRSINKTILVTSGESLIEPKIVASPLKGTAPLKVNFNATGSKHNDTNKTLTSFEWDFGDGTPVVRSREISHTFSANGVYNVILTITDSAGDSVQEVQEIEVTDELMAPEAKIISTPAVLVGNVPFTVNFNGNASIDLDGEIVSYKWFFGDESPQEAGPLVTHTYNSVGTYTVRLEVEDNDNKKGTTTSVVTVRDALKVGPKIELTTEPSPAQGNVPLTITFDASNTIDEDGEILSYEWDFGDGSKIIQTTAPKTTYKYQKVGLWPVTLTVYDDDGLSTSKTIKVAVNTEAPVADFEASKQSAYAPAEIIFDAANSTGNIVDYTWNFGDGNLDSGIVVNHLYQKSGSYNVILTVEDAQGQIDTKTLSIKIN